MDFDFVKNLKELDERSVFANRICKLLYEKHKGDLDKAIIEAEPYFTELEVFVRNIYELVETEIPLFAYYRLLKFGADNWGFEKKEYDDNIAKTKKACKLYYGNSTI